MIKIKSWMPDTVYWLGILLMILTVVLLPAVEVKFFIAFAFALIGTLASKSLEGNLKEQKNKEAHDVSQPDHH
ncbi:MAG: hypothetical protein PHT40_00065 [Patescibacteria group bacterium]|nr:hypothetical protein [Patescibacteria group bacterium]